jgi:hypothetical protein
MNVNELKRKELSHIESVIAVLETSRNSFPATCWLNQPTYWKARVLRICDGNAEADISARARKLIDRLSAISQ